MAEGVRGRVGWSVDWETAGLATVLQGVLVHYWWGVHASSRQFENTLLLTPTILVAGVVFLFVLASCVRRSDQPRPDHVPLTRTIALLMLLFGTYVVSLPTLGLDLGTALFTAAAMRAQGERRIWQTVGYPIALAVFIALAVRYGLPMDLPMLLF